MQATGGQDQGTEEDEGDRENLGATTLLDAESCEDHQYEDNEVEEKAAGKARLAKRCNDENEDGERNGDEGQAEVARPKLADMQVESRPWCRVRMSSHEGRPLGDLRFAMSGGCGDSGRAGGGASRIFLVESPVARKAGSDGRALRLCRPSPRAAGSLVLGPWSLALGPCSRI